MIDGTSVIEIVKLGPYIAVPALALLVAFRAWNGVPAFMAQWLEFRKARAVERAADWTRLREEIGFLRDALQVEREERRAEHHDQLEENERCRTELAAAVRRIGELEGYMTGQGRAAQEAAGVTALDRLSDRAERATRAKKRGKPDAESGK